MTDDNTTPEEVSGVDAAAAPVAEAPAPTHADGDHLEASVASDVAAVAEVSSPEVASADEPAASGPAAEPTSVSAVDQSPDAVTTAPVDDPATVEPAASDTTDLVAEAAVIDAASGESGAADAEPAAPVSEPVAPVFVYQPGDIVPGVISVVGANGIEADLGDGAVAVIPRAELVGTDEPAVGDAVEGTVTKLQTGTGRYVISPKRAARTRAWARITAAHESGEPVTGTVTSTTKGGLIVDLGIRAFLPESLVDVRRGTNLSSLVGQEVEVVVIEAELLSGERAAVERRGEKVVVNRKMLMGKVRDAQRAEMLASISVGQKFTGPVTAVTDFGAFVDIGGAEGLVHVSELAHRQVRKPSDVVKVGDIIDVSVKEIRGDKGKISLSRKAALPSPWKAFQNVHQVGDLVYGTVTGTAEFGAFVQVEGEGFEPIEGLIHISELSRYRVEQASDVVAVGEGVWTQILSIEPEKRRLALSLRRALEG